MVDFVKTIVTKLVENKDDVNVTLEDENMIKIRVATSDIGKVIGKQARTIKAIRIIVSAAAARENKKFMVSVEE